MNRWPRRDSRNAVGAGGIRGLPKTGRGAIKQLRNFRPERPTKRAPVRRWANWSRLNGARAARDIQLQPITIISPPMFNFAHIGLFIAGAGPSTSEAGLGQTLSRFRIDYFERWSVLTICRGDKRGRLWLCPSPSHQGVYRRLRVLCSRLNPRRSIMITSYRPPCPKCKATATLARIIRTFECRACDHIYQRVVALVDPMESKETAGWFRGELRAPM